MEVVMIYLDHLCKATNGVLHTTGKQSHFDAFSHDTRQLIPGELFVAVRGERGDGHDYLLDAVRRGASGLLVEEQYINALSEEVQATLMEAHVATIVVEDTRLALQQYAQYILDLWHPTVIAVTGSTGKTSTKEAIAAVLSSNFATFKSWQNYNDLLGLPLSLGRLEERHEYAVLELACDHPGEMKQLCQMVEPFIGVLTNISPTQLQYFGTVERLAEEFGALLAALPEGGVAIVNGDDELMRHLLPSCRATVTSFLPSAVQHPQITWEGISGDIVDKIQLSSHLSGKHHFSTLLAAYAVGRQCGVDTGEIQHALANLHPMPGRFNPLPGIHGSRLLDDTHNAAPASVIAGLETVKALPAGTRIAVLGDILRLGGYGEEAHRMVGKVAASCVDYLVVRGELVTLVADAARKAGLPEDQVIITSTHEDAAQVVRQLIVGARFRGASVSGEGAMNRAPTIYIKGSEETRMERVTERLMAQPEQAHDALVRQTPGWKQIVVTRPTRPTWVEIDLSAIANNTRQIAALVGPQVRILASLKADAYGHGALKVARTVLHNGASMLGVATVSEATPLREAGVDAPILVFGYVPHWQMREAVRLGQTVKVHVKVDTGMGRLGIRAEQIAKVLELVHEIIDLPGLELEGIYTHFAMADTQDQTHVRMQLARFQHVLQVVEEHQLRPPLVHAANSAATISLPETHFDMVRPGIALYGMDPSMEVRLPAGFRPALSFKTQVAQVKVIPAGECISYGCTYITERPTRVAVLPVGYADGFRRTPRDWGTVLIHGQEAPLLGRVCM